MSEKRVPLRTCIVCRAAKPKGELIRVVKFDSKVSLDFSGKANGRGCYICDDQACIDKCVKKKVLNRAFKCEIDSSVYEQLAKEYLEHKN